MEILKYKTILESSLRIQNLLIKLHKERLELYNNLFFWKKY